MKYQADEELIPLQLEVDKYRPVFYAGASGDFNLIHIDNDFAKMVGLGGVVLQGLCTMAYVYRAVAGDRDPEEVKKIKVRFRQAVRPLDKLTIKGKVVSVENNLATVDLVAENQKGEQVVTHAYAIVEC